MVAEFFSKKKATTIVTGARKHPFRFDAGKYLQSFAWVPFSNKFVSTLFQRSTSIEALSYTIPMPQGVLKFLL